MLFLSMHSKAFSCPESSITEEQHAEKNSAVPVTSVMEDSGQEKVFECMERNNMQSKVFSFTAVTTKDANTILKDA